MTRVLSVLRSKVRNDGIEIYHNIISEKVQGHWNWLQRRSYLYKSFRFGKYKWPKGEGGTAVAAKKLHPKAWHIFNNIPTTRNLPVRVPLIAVNSQIEVTECLLIIRCIIYRFTVCFKKIYSSIIRELNFSLFVCTRVKLVFDISAEYFWESGVPVYIWA